MKPAWPIENWPVKPLIRLSDTARMTLTPHRITTCSAYGLSRCCKARSPSHSASRLPAIHTRRLTSHLFRGVAAEDAGGSHEQDQDEQHERDGVAVGGRHVAHDHHLGNSHDEPADHGAGNVADAAEHRR